MKATVHNASNYDNYRTVDFPDLDALLKFVNEEGRIIKRSPIRIWRGGKRGKPLEFSIVSGK